MRRASLLFLALTRPPALPATTLTSREQSDALETAGFTSPQWESHPAFDRSRATTSCAVRPHSRASASPRQPLHRASWSNRSRLHSPRRHRSRSLVHARNGGTLYFISTRAFDGKGRTSTSWRIDHQRRILLGRARRLPEPVNSERDGMVSAARGGRIPLLRIEASRRSRRQRHLARTQRRRRPLVR